MTKRTLYGEKTILTEIGEGDAELLVKWRSDPRVIRHFFNDRPITLKQHMDWFFNVYQKDGARTDFIIAEKESGKAAGVCGVKAVDTDAPEISYAIGESGMLGKGLAKDAILTLLRFLKETYGAAQAVALVVEGNDASAGLAEGLGFVMDGYVGEGKKARVYRVAL